MVGPAKGLEHTLSAENMYSINFKAKDSEIMFREHFKRLVSDSIVKTGLRGCVYDFSVWLSCYCSCWYIRHSQVSNGKNELV